MASKDPKMSKQGTAGKRRCVTLMIPQKLENGKSQSMIMASYSIQSPTTCDIRKQKDQL
jgi:hypothetical protein